MNSPTALDDILRELETFGATNDATAPERSKRMLNITRGTGELLAVLVQATRAQRILEIGTSNGYSTLWLARATAGSGSLVTTVEQSPFKVSLAAENFRRARLTDRIAQVHADAGGFMRAAKTDAFDFIFLDSERTEYVGWWPELRRILAPSGLLVVDNATSHPAEVAAFVALVQADARFCTCLAPVGNGEFMAVKARE
ncbi:MAG: class I SAM-dependent methyltransferase [Opitutaceae bacterium]